MKIFAFALRDFDEKAYFEQYCKDLGIEYGYTSEYPTMENAELARGAEGITIITNPMYPELLDRYYSLGVRFIATRSVGYDHIDMAYAKKLGIRISNVSYTPDAVANYTIMMMLMACRKMSYIMDKARLQDFSLKGKLGRELSSCTVGVIGTGRIGERVIEHLSGFGCRLLAYDVYEKENVKKYAEYLPLEQVYAQSDIITLHVPGLPENTHMIGREAFRQMKDGVIFVNAARGLLVDTAALAEALDAGKIGYAALDTIENESGLCYLNREGEVLGKPERALLMSYPNVMVSPHMAFYTDEAVSDMVKNAILGLMYFIRGEENPFEVE